MSKTKITVPQADGEIVVRRGGAGDPVTYKVSDHTVTVDEADAGWFAAQFDGSTPVSGSPAVPKKES